MFRWLVAGIASIGLLCSVLILFMIYFVPNEDDPGPGNGLW